MKLTLKKVNKELKKQGYDTKLVKGEGYFYFVGKEAWDFKCQSVYVFRLNDLSLEQWVKEYEERLKDIK
jgi:hypothetical protein